MQIVDCASVECSGHDLRQHGENWIFSQNLIFFQHNCRVDEFSPCLRVVRNIARWNGTQNNAPSVLSSAWQWDAASFISTNGVWSESKRGSVASRVTASFLPMVLLVTVNCLLGSCCAWIASRPVKCVVCDWMIGKRHHFIRSKFTVNRANPSLCRWGLWANVCIFSIL